MTCSWPHCEDKPTIRIGLLAYCEYHWPEVLDNCAGSLADTRRYEIRAAQQQEAG